MNTLKGITAATVLGLASLLALPIIAIYGLFAYALFIGQWKIKLIRKFRNNG